MPSPIVYEVRPVRGVWQVRLAGDSLSELFDDKLTAVARARELMARQSVARARVMRDDGEIEAEWEHTGGQVSH